MRVLLLIALLGSSGLLFSQNVGISPKSLGRLCAEERAPANFELTNSRTVVGRVIDQSGATFERDVAVQLRSPKSGEVLRTALVVDGGFILGEVQAGSYRLILVKTEASDPEHLKPFDQPQSLTCHNSDSQCTVEVMPKVHGTDDLMDLCPPK